jgi:hypothetical protein
MARVNDTEYALYRHGKGFKQHEEILKVSGLDLSNGGGFEELQQFQQYFSNYRIV